MNTGRPTAIRVRRRGDADRARPRRLRPARATDRRRAAGPRSRAGPADGRAPGRRHAGECHDHRGAGHRPRVRRQERRADHRRVRLSAPRSLPRQADGRPWPGSLVRRQGGDGGHPAGEGLRAGADARDDRPHAGCAGRALRSSAADRRSLQQRAAECACSPTTTTGGYAGTENVGDTPCYHLAFRDTGVNWEIWLPVEGAPLPKRLKVEQTRRKGQPVTDVTFTAWNVAPQLTDATFVASVPSDFEGIAILQKAAAVKKAAPDAAPPVK